LVSVPLVLCLLKQGPLHECLRPVCCDLHLFATSFFFCFHRRSSGGVPCFPPFFSVLSMRLVVVVFLNWTFSIFPMWQTNVPVPRPPWLYCCFKDKPGWLCVRLLYDLPAGVFHRPESPKGELILIWPPFPQFAEGPRVLSPKFTLFFFFELPDWDPFFPFSLFF